MSGMRRVSVNIKHWLLLKYVWGQRYLVISIQPSLLVTRIFEFCLVIHF